MPMPIKIKPTEIASVLEVETGKDADFIVLSGDPLSVYTHVEQTWVEGRKVFDLSIPEDRLAAAVDPAQAMEDAELAALVWDAADALGDRDASLLDLHLRHGLSPAEIAEELGVKANAAHQSLHRMRDRDWVDAEVIPNITHAYELGEFPKQYISALAKLGILGMNLPTHYCCC